MNQQVAPGGRAADITVIRCAEGGSLAQTMANIIVGLQALKAAPPKIKATPRLVGTPGYTAQRLTGVARITPSNRGSGYTAAPSVTLTGGGGTGAVAAATISRGHRHDRRGLGRTGYTSAPTVVIAPPAGGGTRAVATATVTGGAVTGITVTNKGHGYGLSEIPAVTLVGGEGTGALATPTLTGVIGAWSS